MALSIRLLSRLTGVGLIALAVVATAGCGGQKLYPVHGQVVFPDGTPLDGGWVTFEPVDPNLKISATADIQSDGSFHLGTHGQADGAPEGEYKVVVRPHLVPEPDESRPRPLIIKEEYQRLATTPLRFTVTRDKEKNNFRIEVTRP